MKFKRNICSLGGQLFLTIGLLSGLTSFLCSQANAKILTESSSWKQILRAKNYHGEFGKVPMPGNENGTWYVSRSSVCIEGDSLRSIHKLRECVNGKEDLESTICDEWVSNYVSAPLESLNRDCLSWDPYLLSCEEWGPERKGRIETEFEVPVYKGSSNSNEYEDLGQLVFTKMYTVPNCEDVIPLSGQLTCSLSGGALNGGIAFNVGAGTVNQLDLLGEKTRPSGKLECSDGSSADIRITQISGPIFGISVSLVNGFQFSDLTRIEEVEGAYTGAALGIAPIFGPGFFTAESTNDETQTKMSFWSFDYSAILLGAGPTRALVEISNINRN